MSKLIKIEKSSLQIKELTVDEFKGLIKLDPDECRFLDPDKPLVVIIKNSRKDKIPLYYSVYPQNMTNLPKDPEYWVLFDSKEYVDHVINYDISDTLTICGVIEALSNFCVSSMFSTKENWYNILITLERLCRATKMSHIIQGFYKTIGWRRRFVELVTPVDTVFLTPGIDSVNQDTYIYREGDYDVLDLLDDLISDGESYINMTDERNESDPYVKISPTGEHVIKYTTAIPDQWCKIKGKLGNTSRANLSLVYAEKINIEIPNNEFGLDGNHSAELSKRVCIIKDGYLWKRLLSVKISDKLLKKLEDNKVTYYDCFDSILIDLSSIPLISRKRIESFSSLEVCRNLYNQIVTESRLYYVLRFIPDQKKPIDEVEDYLKGLVDKCGLYIQDLNDDNLRTDQMNSIQFSAEITIGNKQSKFPRTYKGADIAKFAYTQYQNNKSFTYESLKIIFEDVQNRLDLGEDPEEIVSECKENLKRLKSNRVNQKITLYNLTGCKDFAGENKSYVETVNKNASLGIQVKFRYGRCEIPYMSYKW